MNNVQQVKVELHNGGFRLADSAKIEGLNPKALMLCAAGQCTGFTIMSILRKDNITPKVLEITVEGWLDTPTLQPSSKYEKFKVSYNVECHKINEQDIVSDAVLEAQTKTCGVIAMLRKIAPVDHDISIVSTETQNI